MNRAEFSKLGPGLHEIDVERDIDLLFEIDDRVAHATPALLPLESPQELVNFLVKEHKTENFIFNDETSNPVGYLAIIPDFDEESIEVLNIGTDPREQGKGYGKVMMQYAEQIARKKGKNKIRLVTNVKNTQAVGFYKAIGYKIAREAENYYGDGENRYIFEKLI